MKKIILTISIGIIFGISLCFLFNKKITLNQNILAINLNNEAYAIQIGVYKDYNNALEEKNNYQGIIIKENDLYRVYIDIIKDYQVLQLVKTYLNKNNINYYLKKIKINDQFLEKLGYYEELFLKTNEGDYPDIMNCIVKEYENNVYD